MPLSAGSIGKTYGPFTYDVGLEKVKEFALAISGGVPSSAFPTVIPETMNRHYWDEEFARGTRHGGVIAPPTFCVVFALKPFAVATMDPELDINLMALVHGEQEFEFLEPVRPGDRITTVGTITGWHEKQGKDFLTLVTESRNQHGRVAVRGTWLAVIRKQIS